MIFIFIIKILLLPTYLIAKIFRLISFDINFDIYVDYLMTENFFLLIISLAISLEFIEIIFKIFNFLYI